MISAGGRARWREVETAVGTMFAVVAQVFGQDPAQMALAEDQHAIAQFGAQGADPPLRVRVRARTARRGLDHLDPRAGKNVVEGGGELPTAITQQNPELLRPERVNAPRPRTVRSAIPNRYVTT
jgi:hypothetical protein